MRSVDIIDLNNNVIFDKPKDNQPNPPNKGNKLLFEKIFKEACDDIHKRTVEHRH